MTAIGSNGIRTARVPRGLVVGLAISAAVLVAAVMGGRPGRDGAPLDPRSDGPLGTSALVSLLEGLGADVDLSVGLPDPSDQVALLLQDSLDADQAAAIDEWVRAGGTLVVTDPGSPFAPTVTAQTLLDVGEAPDPVDRGACTSPALADVEQVAGGATIHFDPAGATEECFSDDRGAYLVVTSLGGGEVVAIGGAALFTNDLLGEADNAVLAAAVLAPGPGAVVRFVEAPLPAGGGDKTLSDLVAPGLKRGLLQLAVAFVLYALWRAIRHGQPVTEDQPVELAGSELVAAVGRLLARTRAPAAAADAIRQETRRALRARFGVPPDASPEALAATVASASPLTADQVLAAVGGSPVTNETELVAVARAASVINQEVLR